MQLRSDEIQYLIWLIESQDWLGLIAYSRRMMHAAGSGLMKKYKHAVGRVERHYYDSFRRQPYPGEWAPEKVDRHRMYIAFYCREFASAGPLIADITAVRSKGLKPRSLAYFMVTAKGAKASRWDLLLSAKREADWLKVKKEEQEFFEKSKGSIDTPVCGVFSPPVSGGDKGGVTLSPQNQIWIRAAQSEFNAAIQSGDRRTAERLARKIMSLTGINLLDTRYAGQSCPAISNNTNQEESNNVHPHQI